MKLKVDDVLINATEADGEGAGIVLIIVDMTERAVAVMNARDPAKPLIWYTKLNLLIRINANQLKLIADEKVEGFVE